MAEAGEVDVLQRRLRLVPAKQPGHAGHVAAAEQRGVPLARSSGGVGPSARLGTSAAVAAPLRRIW